MKSTLDRTSQAEGVAMEAITSEAESQFLNSRDEIFSCAQRCICDILNGEHKEVKSETNAGWPNGLIFSKFKKNCKFNESQAEDTCRKPYWYTLSPNYSKSVTKKNLEAESRKRCMQNNKNKYRHRFVIRDRPSKKIE